MALMLGTRTEGHGQNKTRERETDHLETPVVFFPLSHLAAAMHMIVIMSDLFEPLFTDAAAREFAAGDLLFRAGDPVVSMILLRAGRADLVRHTDHGLKMILQRAGPGQTLAEASAWSDTYHCDAVAAESCVAALLPRHVFVARLRSDPDLAELWARNLARAVQAARLRAEIRSLPRVADRLDAWLGEGHNLPEKGRLQEVAAELGVTREALYRELSRRRSEKHA
ncbi:Crp/Fnr family transcriptional regulator [Paracoccus sp. R12_2]|uniref:Crp/Fnr family transcriptional regulator n=2 Tax=Paracoccus TaxID=265 RepID=UPI001ADD59B9|nr:Crp/Fnr family transcriptional regulator [Paracoccus sp. R12_2]MBO9456204.1 Crp/Fnr family transcriptional regulator [Paracoccus sp. R12_2]